MTQKTKDLIATGYNMGINWCLRCDVGERGMQVCWLCEQTDEVHSWRWGAIENMASYVLKKGTSP